MREGRVEVVGYNLNTFVLGYVDCPPVCFGDLGGSLAFFEGGGKDGLLAFKATLMKHQHCEIL